MASSNPSPRRLIVNRTVTETVAYEMTDDEFRMYENEEIGLYDLDAVMSGEEESLSIDSEEINWTRPEAKA